MSVAVRAPLAFGDTVWLGTAPGATNAGYAVDAKISVATLTNEIVVDIWNLQADPVNIGQLISGFTFNLTTLNTNTATTTVDALLSGPLIAATTWTPTPVIDTTDTIENWPVVMSGTKISGSALGHSAYDLIIGLPSSGGTYSGQGESIKNCHACPFVEGHVSLDIHLQGITTASTIDLSTVVVSFGTVAGENVPMAPLGPEPASWVLMGTGLFGLVFGAATRQIRKRGTAPPELNSSV